MSSSSNAIAEEKQVFLAFRTLFDGQRSHIRRRAAIMRVIGRSRERAVHGRNAMQDLSWNKIVTILQRLLRRGIFESESNAKAAFPDLLPHQAAVKVESKNSDSENESGSEPASSDFENYEDIKAYMLTYGAALAGNVINAECAATENKAVPAEYIGHARDSAPTEAFSRNTSDEFREGVSNRRWKSILSLIILRVNRSSQRASR